MASDTFDSTSKCDFDVFLSFAGKDTRLNFTGHLYDAFIRSGIRCFRDDVDLPRGEDINYLFQAIQNSLCAVLVISENYANSTWCLDELQEILESQNTLNRWIFPIFYDVNPADVRYQRESFGKALAELEQKFKENTTKVQNWRTALSKIGNLSGWVSRGKHEADLIKNIVGVVWTYLSSKLPSYKDNLVGINSRVGDMVPILEIGLDDKRFVGIWGMGGVGKTTLARVVSEKLSYKFDICCFLEKVKDALPKDLVSLQKSLLSHLKIKDMEIYDGYKGMLMIRKLLCNKKVLLVLDDIDDMSQLKNLAESPDWFGRGSRIIITTRNSQLLTSSRVDKHRIYEMKIMKKDESLQLFCNKVFNKDHPEENYLELSKSVVKYAGGLPLALEVLGNFFCGKSEAEWRDALDRLKQNLDNNILQVLKLSYDGLNEEEKTIFLDIACFFKYWQKKVVTQILESCDLHSTIGIKVLIERSLLVETEDCKLDMHDLLKDLGLCIVNQESPNVGKRSRLWKFEDIKEVLENNKGSKAIQAIVLQDHGWNPDKIDVHPEAFLKMSNIRLLLLYTEPYTPLILPSGLKLSRALKVVRWPLFPFKALPLPMDKLVHIDLYNSKIKQLWQGTPRMKKLKFINLSYSSNFIETPDFSEVPYLEHLCLRCCTSLVKVHESLGKLKELAEVYLDNCGNLEILPTKLETNSLIKLHLHWCSKVAVLPEFGEGMKKLSHLDVSYTSITRLPESIRFLTGLRDVNLSGCKILNLDKLLEIRITRQISGLNTSSLTELYLERCGLIDGSIPNDFGNLSSLIALNLSGNKFVNLPTGCFSSLYRVIFLSLDGCKRLKSLPRFPPQLIRLNASCCKSMEPLSDRQLWDLVASLDHEHRGQTKYVIFDYIPLGFKHVESAECLPLRDFCAIIPGSKIPSWFLNKECYALDENRREYEIEVNIPQDFRYSKWSGIVVCFHISGIYNGLLSWSSKAPEDDEYMCNEWAHYIVVEDNQMCHLCMVVLELNEKTCWQHLRAHNSSLHIKLSTYCERYYSSNDGIIEILGCGWRVICKEEIKEWCNLNDFNQLTPPQLASPHEVKLPWTVFNDFIHEVYE